MLPCALSARRASEASSEAGARRGEQCIAWSSCRSGTAISEPRTPAQRTPSGSARRRTRRASTGARPDGYRATAKHTAIASSACHSPRHAYSEGAQSDRSAHAAASVARV